ncbi:MAG: hypothetical protein LBR40_01060 [Bacilli bacterium]|jgi:hypothetical protein|nr:hypothetical protein [Bacilli bacterium]
MKTKDFLSIIFAILLSFIFINNKWIIADTMQDNANVSSSDHSYLFLNNKDIEYLVLPENNQNKIIDIKFDGNAKSLGAMSTNEHVASASIVNNKLSITSKSQGFSIIILDASDGNTSYRDCIFVSVVKTLNANSIAHVNKATIVKVTANTEKNIKYVNISNVNTNFKIIGETNDYYQVLFDKGDYFNEDLNNKSGFIKKEDVTIPISKISALNNNIELNLNSVFKLDMNLSPNDYTKDNYLTYTLSNNTIAFISDDGTISTHREGYSSIKVKSFNKLNRSVEYNINLTIIKDLEDATGYARYTSNVYAYGSVSAPSITKLASFEKITVTAEAGDYFKIKTSDNKIGYILKSRVIVPITKVTFNTHTISAIYNKTYTLNYKTYPSYANSNSSISLISNNSKVIKSISSKYIHAAGEGNTSVSIYVTSNVSNTIKISAKDTMNINSLKDIENSNGYLKYNSYLYPMANASNGKLIKKNSKVTICMSAGSFYYVKYGSSYHYILKSSLNIPATGIRFSHDSYSSPLYKTFKISYSLIPSYATSNKKVTFKTTNWKLASVSSSGYVRGKKISKTSVKVNLGSKKYYVKVYVTRNWDTINDYIHSNYVFNFYNSMTSFCKSGKCNYSLTTKDKNKLIAAFQKQYKLSYSNSKKFVENFQNQKWGGSCFGISLVTILNYKKEINIKKYTANTTNRKYGFMIKYTHDPSSSTNLKSLINYYQFAGYIYLGDSYCSNCSKSYSTGLRTLYNNAVNNKLQILSFNFKIGRSDAGHALIVKGLSKRSVKNYPYVLLLLDPNNPKKLTYIYINSSFTKMVFSTSAYNNGLQKNIKIVSDFSKYKAIDID